MISIDELAEAHPELRLMTGYDGCILGIENARCDAPTVIYSFDKVIARNMEDGMSREDAVEFWGFNQDGCNMPEWVFADEVEGLDEVEGTK
jgi:hypothetical protein